MPQLVFNPIGESLWLALLVACALAAVVWLVTPQEVEPRRRRFVLVALRWMTFVLLIVLLLRPTLIYTSYSRISASIAILVDDSKSMSVADELNGATRYERAANILAEADNELKRLAENFDVQAYTFSENVEPVALENGRLRLPESPEGSQTAIGRALEELNRQAAGKRLLGVILLSDGAQRAIFPNDVPPQTIATRMGSVGQRIYPIRLGKTRAAEDARDLAVEDILADDRVFVNNYLHVTTHVRATGFANRQAVVRLLFETQPGTMEPVAEQTITIDEAEQRIPVRFQYQPTTPGEWKATVEIEPDPSETASTNNSQSTLVRVLEGGIHVLYVEGSLRPEQRFLRASLDASPEIAVDYVRLAAPDEAGRPADFAEQVKSREINVFLIGDVDSTWFRQEELEVIRDAVEKGAGLMMLGGFQSFGAGGYAETPLAEVLPVVMNRFERQDPDEPIRKDLHWPGPLRMAPTLIGRNHYLLMLAPTPQSAEAVWQRLPPLDGANRFSNVKPGAVILAVDQDNHPLLVAQSYGRGRVLGFAGDSTWRWWMHGFDREHKRFWRQAVLWLAQMDESQTNEVWVRIDRRRVPLGETVPFEVGANDPMGNPIETARFEVELLRPDGSTEPVEVRRVDDRWKGTIRQTDSPGDYTVRVRALEDGRSFGQDEGRFIVLKQDLELERPAADLLLLEELARLSGGEVVPPEELGDLLKRLLDSAEDLEVPLETRKPLWDTWWMLVLFVGLMTAEWILRKHWGLV
ncbi:glutamine amidotransferase [Thermostilla marina]